MYGNRKESNANPRQPVGTVLINGKLDGGQLGVAMANKNAYYPPAGALHRDDWATVGKGDIAFGFHSRKDTAVQCQNSDPYNQRQGELATLALTVANGQGDAASDNFELMSKIRIKGIIEEGTEENLKDVFNLLLAGVRDVRNNGKETIRDGDRVMAYFPTREEAKRGGGSNKDEGERAGVVKLWYVPYRPEMHRNQLKQIYACLTDAANNRSYLPSFRKHCGTMIDSILGCSMVVFARYLPQLKKLRIATLDDAQILTHFMESCGHSEFTTPRSAPLYNNIVDSLCVPFSPAAAGGVLFDTENRPKAEARLTEMKQHLNEIQAKSTSLFIESTASFVRVVDELVVGTAKSTARPGDYFLLHFDIS